MSVIVIAQLVTAIAVIILVLLQNRSGGAGSAFGGGSVTGDFLTHRRGSDKVLFIATVVFIAIFALLSILSLIFH